MVAWADIVAECGNYKDGFVAVFRRYEGETTDEKDGRGAWLKVSQNSFADHMGIARETFKRWVRNFDDPARLGPDQKATRTEVSHRNVVKNMAKSNAQATVDSIMDAGTGAADQVFHELKLRRAGVDTSKANQKAANAFAHAQTEPIRRAVASTYVALCVQALKEATEDLQKAQEDGALNNEAMAQISEAHEAFQFALTEARFAVS